jgi:hypothetical protein
VPPKITPLVIPFTLSTELLKVVQSVAVKRPEEAVPAFGRFKVKKFVEELMLQADPTAEVAKEVKPVPPAVVIQRFSPPDEVVKPCVRAQVEVVIQAGVYVALLLPIKICPDRGLTFDPVPPPFGSKIVCAPTKSGKRKKVKIIKAYIFFIRK